LFLFALFIEPLFQLLEGTAKLPKVVAGVNDPDFSAVLGNILATIFHRLGDPKDANEVFGSELGPKVSSLIADIKAYQTELKKRNDEFKRTIHPIG
jgi:hypothetical protein